jgi:glutamine synthetase
MNHIHGFTTSELDFDLDEDGSGWDYSKITARSTKKINHSSSCKSTKRTAIARLSGEDKTIIDYVWLGGQGEIRTKVKVLYDLVTKLEDIPIWNYDGSSTGQATGTHSEIVLKPCRLFKYADNGSRCVVICDTYYPDGKAHETNHRIKAKEIFDKYLDQKPWYGLEQEYFIFRVDPEGIPLGAASDIFSRGKQGQFYCSVGASNAFGRKIVEEHMMLCLSAGLKISGINGEVAAGQWEFQIGPVEGIDAADQLIAARYFLELIAEQHSCRIEYHPKPLEGDWNGSGCHTNFSTEAMRQPGGYDLILATMPKLEARHLEHMAVYGKENKKRMSGLHETSSYDKFSVGIGNRGCSIRIPNTTVNDKCGYFEDRRPASNIDPYQVTSILLETVML